MPLPVLCFVLIVIALAAGGTVAEQTRCLPLEVQVERHLELLQSDSPATRQRVMLELMHLAKQTDLANRESITQSMLRYCLSSDLETQLSVERLVDDIRILNYQENLERLLGANTTQEQPTSPLRESWDVFSSRASQDEDARDAFRQIALRAGPTLHWRQLHGRLPPSELDIVLISHLGCLAPETPQLFGRQSRDLFSQLVKIQLQSTLPSLAEAKGRVIGRLIDRTLVDNPYGWTMPERLHLALAYQRDKTAGKLSGEVLRTDQPLARDLAAAMLAWRRLVWLGSDADAIPAVAVQRRVIAALDDRRVVCVSPERLVAERPVAEQLGNERPRVENQAKNHCVHLRAIIRTRVQDVAGWVLLQGSEIDVRDAGMSSLRADPVWGAELSSIGFASEQLRERFQAQVETQLSSRH